MVVLNTTLEDAPSSPPMDLTVVPVEGTPSSVTLNWQPPKVPNGRITGNKVLNTHFSSFLNFLPSFFFLSLQEVYYFSFSAANCNEQ